MVVFGRIGREYVAQIAGFAVTITDRLLTAGIFVRIWGAEGFAAWTVALSAAAMLALFDFGLTAYFSNRLFFAVEQKADVRARHVFGAGNAALIAASVCGTIIVCVVFLLFGAPGANTHTGISLFPTMAALALATAVRQAMAVVMAVYRAHQDFFRQTMIAALGDSLRIMATIAAALAGASVFEVAVTYLAAAIIMTAVVPMIDVARKYPGFTYRTETPDREERQLAIRTSLSYWAQGAVNTLVTFAPVFFLAGAGAVAHSLAQFALMRTLANLVRAILQLFANVFGLEAARRIALSDASGFSQVYGESTIFLAVQTAVAAAVLAVLARPLFTVWTGDPSLFDQMLLWLAIGPPLVLPSMTMAVQVLTCANMPKPLLIGRLAQFVITIAGYFVLPIADSALRMMLALAIGEVIGLGSPTTRAMWALDPHTGIALHARLVWRSVIAGFLTYMSVTSIVGALPDHVWIRLVVGGASGAAALGIATLFLGITPARRSAIATTLKAKFRLDQTSSGQ